MAKYSYTVKTKEGDTKKGELEAFSKDLALDALQNKGFTVLSLGEKAEESNFLSNFNLDFLQGVSNKDLIVFSRLLAVLLNVQMPLIETLHVLREQTDNPYFIKVIDQIIEDIQQGSLFSEALSKHKDVFPQLYVAIVKSGEASGTLQESLAYMAAYLEEQNDLNERVKSALTYPLIVVVLFIAIALGISFFILPQLVDVLRDLTDGEELPLATRLIVGFSDFLQAYTWQILLAIVAVIGGIVYFFRTETGARSWDVWQLHIPLLGSLFRKTYIARFSQNMYNMLEGGIPLLTALNISADVVGNRVFYKIIRDAIENVKGGGTMSEVFLKHEQFPNLAAQMIRVGEDSGNTGKVLNTISEFYKKEVQNTVDRLTTLIEPIMIIIIGIGVAGFIFAIFMPIYNVVGNLGY